MKKCRVVYSIILLCIGIFIADLIRNALMNITASDDIKFAIKIIFYIIPYSIFILAYKNTIKFKKGIRKKYVILIFPIALIYILIQILINGISLIIFPVGSMYTLTNIIIPKTSMNTEYIWVYTFLTSVILAPVIEEVIYRGIMIKTLLEEGCTNRKAIMISAVIFSIAHLSLINLLNGLIFGLIEGYLYLKTKDLKINILFHMTINLITFISLMLAI